jgi:hypothetical protein
MVAVRDRFLTFQKGNFQAAVAAVAIKTLCPLGTVAQAQVVEVELLLLVATAA